MRKGCSSGLAENVGEGKENELAKDRFISTRIYPARGAECDRFLLQSMQIRKLHGMGK